MNPSPRAASAAVEISLDDVLAARERIAGLVHRTPMLSSTALSRMAGVELSLKAENLQRTGAFKVRGGLNAVALLSPEQRSRGVVTMSAGNHGQGLAYAAARAGVRCVVFMPENAVPTKVEAIRGYGAEARFAPTMEQVFEAMESYRVDQGLHFVHPFADAGVIAGAGTIGLEILEDVPDVGAIVTGVGGGGNLSGIAIVMRALRPQVRVVGVEPVGAAAVSKSLAAGRRVVLDRIDTVADGLAGPFSEDLTQSLVERLVDDVVVLTDDQIVNAMRLIIERTKLVVEPAGAAGVAAILEGEAGVEPGSRVVAVLTGGNVDRAKLARLL